MRTRGSGVTMILLSTATIAMWMVASSSGNAAPAKPASLEAAEAYANNCASCHGVHGEGDGVITQPEIWNSIEGIDRSRRPRNYTREWFRFGDSKAEIIQTIGKGSPGTAMNGFTGVYSPAVISELATIVLNFRGNLSNAVIRQQFPDRIPAELR